MRFKIFSHIRSGTEWFIKILETNLHEEVRVKKAGHRLVENEWLRFEPIKTNNIYIVRDGRDTLVSSYKYWVNGGSPRFKIGDAIEKHNVSFSQFLRGETPWNGGKELIHYNHVLDPVCHWVNHTRWIYYAYYVRYEDLKNNFREAINTVSREFNTPLIHADPKPVDKLVGVKPRKGIVGDWKNYFNEKDLEYFWKKAGHRMVELGYMEN
jgi:hypothetical protein